MVRHCFLTLPFPNLKSERRVQKKKKKKESSAKIVARYCCQFYQIESEISAIVTVAALNKHLERRTSYKMGLKNKLTK